MKAIISILLIGFYLTTFGQQKMVYQANYWKNLKTNNLITDTVEIIRDGSHYKVRLGTKNYDYKIVIRRPKENQFKTEYLVKMEDKVYTLAVVVNEMGTSIGVEDAWEVDNIDLNHTFLRFE